MDLENIRNQAKDETTAPDILAELATSENKETRKYVASNPNTPKGQLLYLSWEFPSEVFNNPVIPLLLLENPLLLTCERVLDFNKITHLTDLEVKRLGWTKEQARKYIRKVYKKRTRLHLTDEQLVDLLHRLRTSKSDFDI